MVLSADDKLLSLLRLHEGANSTLMTCNGCFIALSKEITPEQRRLGEQKVAACKNQKLADAQ